MGCQSCVVFRFGSSKRSPLERQGDLMVKPGFSERRFYLSQRIPQIP